VTSTVTDWHALRDCYGPADDVPRLLDSVTPDDSHPAWHELWSRLCHQGTVYPASFAALPRLESLARAWNGPQRDPLLHLAGAIVCSRDRVDVDGDPLGPLDGTIRKLHQLALECLEDDRRSELDFVYLLQAVRGLERDALWGIQLDGLAAGELPARCPACAVDLYVVVGEDGHFVTTDERLSQTDVVREAITPAEVPLHQPGEWMRRAAMKAGQSHVAVQLGFLFGTSICSSCAAPFQIPEAVAAT
jgi:hypothetical protein